MTRSSKGGSPMTRSSQGGVTTPEWKIPLIFYRILMKPSLTDVIIIVKNMYCLEIDKLYWCLVRIQLFNNSAISESKKILVSSRMKLLLPVLTATILVSIVLSGSKGELFYLQIENRYDNFLFSINKINFFRCVSRSWA